MRRRHLLNLALAGTAGAAVGATSARAQAQAVPRPSGPPGVPPGPSGAVEAHIRGTAAAGAESLLVSRAAQAKLRHPMTRQFADFEVAEQVDLAVALKARATRDGGPAGAGAPPTDAEAEGALDEEGRAAVSRFRDMAAGPELERSYVQAQVDGHKKLLGLQDAYLLVADDAAEAAIATLVRGRIREHLVILADIARHLG